MPFYLLLHVPDRELAHTPRWRLEQLAARDGELADRAWMEIERRERLHPLVIVESKR